MMWAKRGVGERDRERDGNGGFKWNNKIKGVKKDDDMDVQHNLNWFFVVGVCSCSVQNFFSNIRRGWI